jgi:MFS family permease
MRNRSTIAILGVAQFVMVLDTTVMNVSISNVVADLDTTVSGVQAAITLYALVMAAFMLTGAKLGDMFGRRRIFAIGLGVYGVGSFITSISPSLPVLIGGWSFVEGLGAVMVIPAIAALTAANYEGHERAVAFGLLGGIAGAAVAAGPLIGGFVTSALTWRVVFAAESVVVVAILLFGVRRIRDSTRVEGAELDYVGAALSALGLSLAVFGILKSSQWGLITPIGALTINGTEVTPFGLSMVPFFVAAGFGVLLAFRHWELRRVRLGRMPLLSPDLMQIPQLRNGLSMYASTYLIMAGSFFILPLYLQLVLGKDAFETGVAILPISVTMMLAAIAGARLASRRSPRWIVRVGLVVTLVGLVALLASITPSLTSPLFSVSLALFGLGVGLVVSQIGNVVMSSVDQSRSSEVGGLQGSAQSLGSALGTALIGAVLLAGLTSGFHERIQADSTIPESVQQQLVTGTEQGVPMVSKQTVEDTVTKASLPPDQADSIVDEYGDAQIAALKRAVVAAALFALLGLWIASNLPGVPLGTGEEEVGPEDARAAPAAT